MSLFSHHREIKERNLDRERRDNKIREYAIMGMKPIKIAELCECSKTHVNSVIRQQNEEIKNGNLLDLQEQFKYAIAQIDLLWSETWNSYLRSCNDEIITEDFEVLDGLDEAMEFSNNGIGTKTLKKIARKRDGEINHLRTLLEILRFKNKLLGLESIDLSDDKLSDIIDNFDVYAHDIVESNQNGISTHDYGLLTEIQSLIANV